MRIVTVFGTRPEAIKMAPIIRAARAANIEIFVCVTAQHRGILDQMLRVFDVAPDYDLNLMRENQTPLEFAARVFEKLPAVLRKIAPDWLRDSLRFKKRYALGMWRPVCGRATSTGRFRKR